MAEKVRSSNWFQITSISLQLVLYSVSNHCFYLYKQVKATVKIYFEAFRMAIQVGKCTYNKQVMGCTHKLIVDLEPMDNTDSIKFIQVELCHESFGDQRVKSMNSIYLYSIYPFYRLGLEPSPSQF